MSDNVDRSPLRPDEMEKARRYTLVIEWSVENDAFLDAAPDLPGLVAHGSTRAKAAEMGEEAIAVWLSATRSLGRTVPTPTFTTLPGHLRPARELADARRPA